MRIAETGGNERRDWKARQKKKKRRRAAALQSLQIPHRCCLGGGTAYELGSPWSATLFSALVFWMQRLKSCSSLFGKWESEGRALRVNGEKLKAGETEPQGDEDWIALARSQGQNPPSKADPRHTHAQPGSSGHCPRRQLFLAPAIGSFTTHCVEDTRI
jgi:hypothetical protein